LTFLGEPFLFICLLAIFEIKLLLWEKKKLYTSEGFVIIFEINKTNLTVSLEKLLKPAPQSVIRFLLKGSTLFS